MIPPHAHSLALLTDLYQVTMGYGYWREGLAEREAVFHLYFRKAPFGAAFAIAAGLDTAVQWLRNLRFRDDDLDYLNGLTDRGGSFYSRRSSSTTCAASGSGATWTRSPRALRCSPTNRWCAVRGSLLQAQLAETALLNIINFQTLVTTKAARVCLAAGDDPVLEFGLRRAQGIDGGISASRAAYIGGCAATSNLLAGKLYGIPVRGTHAHSWVLAFEGESEAFEAFARAMPLNCVLLIDTHDSLTGLRRAIDVAKRLQDEGVTLDGVRLDSGDLATLSSAARAQLDAAGLPAPQ